MPDAYNRAHVQEQLESNTCKAGFLTTDGFQLNNPQAAREHMHAKCYINAADVAEQQMEKQVT